MVKPKILIVCFLILLVIISLSTFLNFNLKKNQNFSEKKCKDLNYNQALNLHPEKLSPFNLEIKFKNEKKWKKTNMESEINAKKNKHFYGTKFYEKNKRTKALLTINFDNKEIKCQISARIRPQGLLDDHRENNQALPSLNIELLDGNIFGITKFYLFRPNTRRFDNEIIVTNILRELNFLSPRTTKVNVKYSGLTYEFIFQETITKEFLEYNKLKEGPIYDAENKFFQFYSKKKGIEDLWYFLTKHKISNNEWSLKGESNMNISKEGLSILNMFIEQYLPIFKRGLVYSDYSSIEKKYMNSNYFDNLPLFDAINFALLADHGLSYDDRVVYFDSLNQNFLPIYWDGTSELLDQYNNLSGFEKTLTITPSVKFSSFEGLQKINQLNVDRVYNKIINQNIKIDKKKFYKLIETVKENLNSYANFSESKIVYPKNTKLENSINESTYLDQDLKNKFKFILVYETNEKNNFILCEFFKQTCMQQNFSNKEISKLIKNDLVKKNSYYIYTGIKKNFISNQNIWFHEDLKNKEKKNKLINDQGLDFIINGEIDYKIDILNKKITFIKKSHYGNIVFNKTSLDNWNIKFINQNLLNYPGIDSFNITGCLNFYDSVLKNISIEIINSNCEDAVNLVRSNGEIERLLIENSKFDSIDADFSELIFKKIRVLNSGNDCIDFSYGKYEIILAEVDGCGDKGISVGELSKLNIDKVFINHVGTGIASKDFAQVIANNSEINNSDYCVQAYNKKLEFYGGYMNLKNLVCKNYKTKFNIDASSLVLN